MVTVRELTRKLKMVKEELQDKPVYVIADLNGLLMPMDIKFYCHDGDPLNKSKENVDYVLLTG